jgi:gluconolactonase
MIMELTIFSDKAKKIFNTTLELENIATGYNFTEGPVWDLKKDLLYFTDFRNFNIFTWQQSKGVELFRKDSGRAIGLSMAADGRIVSTESKSHAITFAGADKSEIIAGSFEGKRLNSPNDVVVKSDGAVFFTDPYSDATGDARELDFNGVFCVPVKDGRLSAKDIILIDRMERPNGIAFSPDEKILYVNDTNKQHIVAYQMHEDNTASYIGVFAALDTSYGPGNADGMKVDTCGNVYLTGPGGIWVLDSSAVPIAILKVPEFAGNLCFGGRDSSTLFITASSSVYKVPVGIPGIVPKRN